MPAQAPSVGQALRSIWPELLLGDGARRAGADGLEHARDVERLARCGGRAGSSRRRRTPLGRSRRAAAISMPGRLLSQPARPTKPSKRSACITVSTESAMTSRDTSEACMPSWPIEMPSDTEIVPNSSGNPPASRTPSLARSASGRATGCRASPRSTTTPRRSGACPSRRRSCRRRAAWPGPAAFCMPSVTSLGAKLQVERSGDATAGRYRPMPGFSRDRRWRGTLDGRRPMEATWQRWRSLDRPGRMHRGPRRRCDIDAVSSSLGTRLFGGAVRRRRRTIWASASPWTAQPRLASSVAPEPRPTGLARRLNTPADPPRTSSSEDP